MSRWGYALALVFALDAHHAIVQLADFLGHFAAHLSALALIGAAALALARRWRGVVMAAFVSLALAAAPIFVAMSPDRIGADPGPDAARMVIVFANLDSNNDQLAQAARLLARQDADALIMAETSMALLDLPLARLYPHKIARLRWVYGGIWIWSRHPAIDGWKQDLSPNRPAAAWARLALAGGGALDLLGLQLRRPVAEQQARQLAYLEHAPPALRRPFLIGADLNAAPWSLSARRVARLFGAHMPGGLRWTWRSDLAAHLGLLAPLLSLPLDHVFVSEGVAVDSVRSFAIPGSDHMGLRVALRVARRPVASDAPAPHRPVVF